MTCVIRICCNSEKLFNQCIIYWLSQNRQNSSILVSCHQWTSKCLDTVTQKTRKTIRKSGLNKFIYCALVLTRLSNHLPALFLCGGEIFWKCKNFELSWSCDLDLGSGHCPSRITHRPLPTFYNLHTYLISTGITCGWTDIQADRYWDWLY